MKLHSFNRQFFMSHTHNFIEATIVILRPGGNLKTVGQGLPDLSLASDSE